jgi:diaminohydroxyphosphoribosylaminopyrimidine deaminase/5-amino-6-(5-phosphoribosylamino)uracil reductase
MSKAADERFMRMALAEARRGIGSTSPNPAVGAIIVRAGRVLARGHHRAAGLPHAEIEAIRGLAAPRLARGATLYVTLEPCSTRGRTPPCTEAIRQAGFARVVIGCTDPNPRHAGRAIRLLRRAGVEVVAGVLEADCRALIRPFAKWITTGLPWVIAKWAMTLDGRLTRPEGESQWLSSPASRARVQELRGQADAILVGAGTVRADNPRLTVRGIPGKAQPWRVVVTRSGDLPAGARLFTDRFRDRTLVYRRKSLRSVLGDLASRGCTTVLAEGGGELLGGLFDAALVDEVWMFLAPRISGGGTPATGGRGVASNPEAIRLDAVRFEQIGDDVLMRGLVRRA